MDLLQQAIDLFLHLDTHLSAVIQQFGVYTYVILFCIIFTETGLVIMPFLPGDSLLFAVGAFAAEGSLHLVTSFVLLTCAAIIGDSVNYWIGSLIGKKAFTINNRFFKHEYLMKTEAFYEKHGGKTIIIARFLPIIRTFAPFVAGVGNMNYATFFFYNVVGGLLWVTLLLGSGFLFGNIPLVRENFETVIVAIIVISILPGIIEFVRHRFRKT
ncbi:hypothetical protein A3D88_01160 [Candidatus Peribacteria bacterium RIFCSPHIGHO2_02_FULL_52_16]|nr:MAG: hypothetical protein A2706_05805 [Candidatus Peribacteria bacterium RIFCSPHIGHO2_01_FULL_51_35]OGJ61272.1 MAG: hypothetical protein A3D88_01160 [Candidatus Peribacteria bacterium RIFCSPHIGHO2_02_FULL_52_16]